MLSSLREAVRDFGAAAAALYAIDRLLTRISGGRAHIYFYRLEVQPVPHAPLLPPHRGRQFQIRELPPDDTAHRMSPRPPAVIVARYAQGGRCIGAFLEQRLVGQIWLQLDGYDEDEVRCRFSLAPQGKVAWDYDVYIDPPLRGGFLFAKLWDAAFEILRQHNVEWTVSRISAFNAGSLTAHKRLGARQVGRAIFVVCGKAQLLICGLRPFMHLALGNTAAPIIHIAAASPKPRSARQI